MPIYDYKNPRRAPERPARFKKPGRWILSAFLLYGLSTLWTVEKDTDQALSEPDSIAVVEADTLPAEPEIEPEPEWTVVSGRIGSGESFSETLVARGLSQDQIFDELKPAIDRIPGRELDLNLVQQGDQYTLEIDTLGTIQQFEYLRRGDLENRFIASRQDGLLKAWKEHTPLDSEVVVVTGELNSRQTSSVWKALYDAGERADALSYELKHIFEYYLDFDNDCHPGDQFALAVEKKYNKSGDFVRYGKVLAAQYLGARNHYRAFLYQTPDGEEAYYDGEGKSMRGLFLTYPLKYTRISSRFTNRRFHPVLKKYIPHHGIDYAAPRGREVWATAPGSISFIGTRGTLGKYVEITHKNGYQTGYGHLSRFAKRLRKGAWVRQKQTIGYVGATGRATGPHLHYNFYIKRNNKYRLINPKTYLPKINKPSGKPIPKTEVVPFRKHSQALLAFLEQEHGTVITALLNDASHPEAASEE